MATLWIEAADLRAVTGLVVRLDALAADHKSTLETGGRCRKCWKTSSSRRELLGSRGRITSAR